MSKLLNFLILSIKNQAFVKENLQEFFYSIVELIDYKIIDKDYVFNEPFKLNIPDSLTRKEPTQINTIKDLFLFIQKHEKTNHPEFHNVIATKIKDLYDIVDYPMFFKVKLADIRLSDKNSDSQKKLSELLSAIPEKELKAILENAEPDDKRQRNTRDLLLHVLFSAYISDIFFQYVERDVFFNSLNKIKKIEDNELYHYIKENLYIHNSDQQNKEIERLSNGLNKYPEIQDHAIFGSKALLNNFLKNRNSFLLIMKNFQTFGSDKQAQIKNYVFEDFFSKKHFDKPSILNLHKVDNLFYERPEFNENVFITILKNDPTSFFVLLDDDNKFKSHIEKMHFNLFSHLIDVYYITKENFQFFVKQHPEFLSQSKNKKNNLTNFLIKEEGRFADWYKMRLYMFERLNLETFAKKCDNVYLNLFNQNFYFSLFADSDQIPNKQLNEQAKKIFVKKLIQYEKDHNIQNCLSSAYFELINISYEYVKKPNKKNEYNILDTLKQISPQLAFNILSAEGYIETLCRKDKNKQFEEKLNILLEQISLNQSIFANTTIKAEIHRI